MTKNHASIASFQITWILKSDSEKG